MNILLSKAPYSYCQYQPNKQRIAAFVDFGTFTEPFMDDKRIKYLHKVIRKDFGLTDADLKEKMKLLRSCLRPISPDEVPIIGPLRYHPNVILNVAYGAKGAQAFCGSKIVEELIHGDNFPKEVVFKPEVL